MKLLLDACVWGGARTVIEAAGHDVVWAGDWPRDPGDDEIMAQAHREERVLVTLDKDKDFGESRDRSGLVPQWNSSSWPRRWVGAGSDVCRGQIAIESGAHLKHGLGCPR